MKIAAREDIEATIGHVFESITDFDGMERAALRRGAEVLRMHELAEPGAGLAWCAKFPYRNRERIADLEITTYDAPHQLVLVSKVSGVEATVEVELLALSRHRTRMNMSIDMRPKTIPARLMLQSMKLARANLLRRFRKRVADYAQHIEDRYTP